MPQYFTPIHCLCHLETLAAHAIIEVYFTDLSGLNGSYALNGLQSKITIDSLCKTTIRRNSAVSNDSSY